MPKILSIVKDHIHFKGCNPASSLMHYIAKPFPLCFSVRGSHNHIECISLCCWAWIAFVHYRCDYGARAQISQELLRSPAPVASVQQWLSPSPCSFSSFIPLCSGPSLCHALWSLLLPSGVTKQNILAPAKLPQVICLLLPIQPWKQIELGGAGGAWWDSAGWVYVTVKSLNRAGINCGPTSVFFQKSFILSIQTWELQNLNIHGWILRQCF